MRQIHPLWQQIKQPQQQHMQQGALTAATWLATMLPLPGRNW
jgi:hypothetical protein